MKELQFDNEDIDIMITALRVYKDSYINRNDGMREGNLGTFPSEVQKYINDIDSLIEALE